MSIKRKKAKTGSIKKKPHKMSVETPNRVRLVLSCTEEEKKYIKALAALENKTVSDYLLDPSREKIPQLRCDFPGCNGLHVPNKETEKVFRDTDQGKNLESHESLEDFWKAMGMKPNAKD